MKGSGLKSRTDKEKKKQKEKEREKDSSLDEEDDNRHDLNVTKKKQLKHLRSSKGPIKIKLKNGQQV
jgi:hypothetical protein